MALKATIYKATVNVANIDRNQFLDASLTLARHPSETQERMMLRLLAWLKYADERTDTVVCVPMMSRKRGCVTITWALICGLSWGCRMSGG
ncbi:YaeQ family protein [Escherichia coli]